MHLTFVRVFAFFFCVFPAQSQILSTTISLPVWGIDSLRSIRLGQISTIHAKGENHTKVYSLYNDRYLNGLSARESVLPPFEGNCLVLSQFDGEPRNALGGGWSAFQRSPSSSSVEYVRSSDGRIALRMDYDRASSGYCGIWMRLSGTYGLGNTMNFFDARAFRYLTFWIRGTAGGEEMLLKVSDAEWERKEDALPVGNISTFVASGRIGTHWQPAVVPFSAFPRELDLAQLATVVFEASTQGSGQVELKNLAICKEMSPLPDLPPIPVRTSEKPIAGKSIWVWNTSEILGKKTEEDNLLSFLTREGFNQVFLALPFDPNHPDARRTIRIRDNMFRPLMRKLNKSGLTVHALTGDKDFILPENHAFVRNSIQEVARYNSSSSPDERFAGIHLDVEPYLLSGFSSPRRSWVLQNFLVLLTKSAETARNGRLRFGVDIPAWFDTPDELTGERFLATLDGTTKSLLEHIIDLTDDVTLMDYRTEVQGENGVIAHARGELNQASLKGKQVYVGLETEPLPDETIMIFREEPLRGWPSGGQTAFYVSLVKTNDSALVAVVPSSELETYRISLESKHIAQTSALFWPVIRQYRVEGNKLSFAALGADLLLKALKESEEELAAYPAFAGFAIHHYRSYRKLR